MACAGAFVLFAKPLGALIYKNEECSKYIGIFAVLVPLMYLDTTVDGMLKGLGEQLSSMKYNIIDSAISVFLVYTLLPRMGIGGYVICIFVTELVNDILSLSRLITVTGVRLPIFRTVISPLFSIVGACSATHLVLKALSFTFFSLAVETVFGIILMLLFYVNFLIIFRALSKEDLSWVASIFKRKEKA
jgi:stage V sporulation protein B